MRLTRNGISLDDLGNGEGRSFYDWAHDLHEVLGELRGLGIAVDDIEIAMPRDSFEKLQVIREFNNGIALRHDACFAGGITFSVQRADEPRSS